MINQVIKIGFKIFLKLTSLFLICIQTAYCQKCIRELIFPLLLCSGDIETNLGPKKTASISFCHWNLNSITTHNFSKVKLLKAMATSSQYDTIYLLEILFDSTVARDDKILITEGYNLIRADHPAKKGRVFMYYKDYLPVTRRND